MHLIAKLQNIANHCKILQIDNYIAYQKHILTLKKLRVPISLNNG